jgi:hypothetical protein
MRKSLVVLAIFGTMSVPAFAQVAQTPAQNSAQTQAPAPAKPQMIKKRVCEQIDENPYSRLGNRKICRTVEVPAPVASNGQNGQAAPSGEPQGK